MSLFQRVAHWLQQPARVHNNLDRMSNWIWGISTTYCVWTLGDAAKLQYQALQLHRERMDLAVEKVELLSQARPKNPDHH